MGSHPFSALNILHTKVLHNPFIKLVGYKPALKANNTILFSPHPQSASNKQIRYVFFFTEQEANVNKETKRMDGRIFGFFSQSKRQMYIK